ncbi:mitochondrial ribosomal subunit S27-domain-containing protein [Chaetomidium leptoderma]|uniref:Small ribosomal subunit protein mS33 n=1 Tax=Chaetomidium leptoderma TaxID=669021 RepID=A0AAN6VCY8_9PEZI|nr:mitochondrial ribosomal subunit S27-domain-containing protein [Chaetomidium leptoderma]
MSVPRARLLDLMRARCELFSTTFNPEGVRTGNKILRQKLKGPALASYYPRKVMTFRDFQKEFQPLELEVENEDEIDRLEHIAGLKSRGKGAPKKKREKDTSKKR